MSLLKILVIGSFVFITGCNNKSERPPPDLFSYTSTLGLRVYEDPFKNIFLNGTLISLKNLEEYFANLKNKGGIVLYSCEGATEQPPENSKVIELVKKYRLPIKMYTDSSFKKPIY